ncbi:MAG TPA: hypothetical protein VGO00_10040 [Kofleriaceae bacterium]|nr:hypothetical protein [Kofleriaceae bacterium]
MTGRALIALIVAACTPVDTPVARIPPVSAGKVRVRVFAQPAPVRSLNTIGKLVLIATDNDLERWDVDSGVLPLPFQSSHVIALATDIDRQRAWILSDVGLGHFDTATDAYTDVPAPLEFAAIAKDGTATLAAAGDGGVFVGTVRGLGYASGDGDWTQTTVKDAVRAMRLDHSGWLWVATKAGLVARKPSGDIERVGAANGCVVSDPRLVVELPGDRTLVIGADDQGRERIAIGRELAWTSYRALPEVRLDAAVGRGTNVVVMGGDRVYRIAPADPSAAVRPLARDGVRLVPLAGSAPSEWSIDPIDLVVPPGATTLGTADDHLLIGTKDLGTARYRDGDSHPLDWLRGKQMFQGATDLTVACAALQDCWVATGTGQAWHWTGDRFVTGGPDENVLAVVRDPRGPLYALHRGATEAIIHLSRIDGATWTPISRVMLTTPGTSPEASYAKFASSGSLWVGLRYHDGDERKQFGLAVVDTATGKTTYHHEEWVPPAVIDADVRGDIAWFATSDGIARLSKGHVREWSMADALHSEAPRAVAIGVDGSVVVATGTGAVVWDGKTWDRPTALHFAINDVVATKNGQIWMATERGIAAWDGTKVRRVDTRRGLAENQVLDVEVDQFDRVWARGPGSLTLISQ